MMSLLKKSWDLLRSLVDRYPIIVAAVAIYLYYLLTSIDLFQHKGEKRSFLDYVMQFDSLIFMWIAAAALLQIQKMRKTNREEERQRRAIETALDRQQMYERIVNDITTLLQDSVNNPLAVISITTQEIRKKFGTETELVKWLDRIDGAISRISITIRDLQAYESQKILQETSDAVAKSKARQ